MVIALSVSAAGKGNKSVSSAVQLHAARSGHVMVAAAVRRYRTNTVLYLYDRCQRLEVKASVEL